MIRVGILGAGHLGRIHLGLAQNIAGLELAGFFDKDPAAAAETEKNSGVKRYPSAEELIADCDAIDIVTPTPVHFLYASMAIKAGKHVFIEKPVTSNAQEAKKLLVLVSEANVVAHVGHVERFNPAYLAARPHIGRPVLIDCRRLAVYNPRGTDVSVVLDLMVHDIDLLLNLVKSPVKKISATGAPVLSASEDVAEARIEFDNGCVANLSVSRVAPSNERKLTVYQDNDFFTLDLLEKTALRSYPCDPHARTLFMQQDKIETQPVNAIALELSLFAKAIGKEKTAAVTLEEAYATMKVADSVIDVIRQQK
jgi:predicted dehydrogenase